MKYTTRVMKSVLIIGIYSHKSPKLASINFICLKDPMHIYNNIKNGETTIVLILNLIDKIDLRSGEKSIALSNISIHYTWNNIKKLYNNNDCKISAPTWNDEFELLDESHSIADIQDYFEYI